MTIKRKSIGMAAHERSSLVSSYLDRAIPVDQYEEREAELAKLCREFNQETGRSDSPGDLLHYMRSQRKQGKWVRLDGKHVPKRKRVELSAEEMELLLTIVSEQVTSLGMGTDELGYDDVLRASVAKEFAIHTGRRVPGGQLIAAVTAVRKRGLLDRVQDVCEKPQDLGFDDIDDVREA